MNVLPHNRGTLGTLGMSDHFHQKRCQLVVTLMIICMQKNHFNLWALSSDIVKTLQT